jgi:hypothetical protein
MASSNSSKVCEAEGNACKKDVQALCYHCSKNLCRVHLMQHAQLIEDKTQSELHSLADKFNELSSRFNHLSISDDILKKPLIQLEKWRTEAHKKIDQIAENKRRELNDELERYRKDFFTKNEEQLVNMNNSKKMIAELIQENDASAKQIADLQKSIEEAEKYLNSLDTLVITVIAQSANWSVDICTNFYDLQATSVDKVREFKVTYICLNGLIRNYYVKTEKNGKMSDLIKSFIRHYVIIEEVMQIKTDGACANDHLPKFDFILPVEVYNHRIHLQYNHNTSLTNILERDVIVFNETPYSLDDKGNPWVLMPCRFLRLPQKNGLGWPVYLNVPRKGCRGQHVLDALHDALVNFFRIDPNADQHLYDATLELTVGSVIKTPKLRAALQDEINFTKADAKLIVYVDSQTADRYEQNTLK